MLAKWILKANSVYIYINIYITSQYKSTGFFKYVIHIPISKVGNVCKTPHVMNPMFGIPTGCDDGLIHGPAFISRRYFMCTVWL